MGDVLRIAVNDAVLVHGRWWRVIGTLSFTDHEGWSWREHLLDGGDDGRRWLAVEDDDEIELVVWTPTTVAGIEPGSGEVIHSGVSYRLQEHGQCSYAAAGHTGTPPTGVLEYYDYAAPGGMWLSFERYGQSAWEMATGSTVPPRDVEVRHEAP